MRKEDILRNARKVVVIADLVGIEGKEIFDLHEEVSLNEFYEMVKQAVNCDYEWEPDMISDCMERILKQLKQAVKNIVSDVLNEEYCSC